ncbi:hypothetical protein ACLJYM_20980 [Rhizobium giardinii]|uniref:hypothetical protein n=1 Tax=Rhizobium giardinii TaxID=56731 RepID=UPI0039E0D34B
MIFVLHHLDEIFRICDRVTVLRNGETSHDELVRGMVGQQLQREMASGAISSAGEGTALSLVNFRRAQSPHADGISLDLHKGEILGITGVLEDVATGAAIMDVNDQTGENAIVVYRGAAGGPVGRCRDLRRAERKPAVDVGYHCDRRIVQAVRWRWSGASRRPAWIRPHFSS